MSLQFLKKTSLSIICTTFLLVVFSISTAQIVQAASLYISPASSNVSVGNIVSVKILVNTQGKYINNSESIVQFPTDLLEVVSTSKNTSIFSLWVEEPKFSNFEGKITYNGGIPNPGYIGAGGEIISIIFKAKKSGSASIVFSDSTVRQNDGLGTDILTSKQIGVITISPISIEVPPTVVPSDGVPSRPVITSSTHPRQDSWYQSKSASFSWVIPSDVTSIQTLLSKSPTSIPTITYDSSVSQRTINDLTDGVLYFHLRYQNSIGWGPVAHYKIQIDTTPPDKFSVQVSERGVERIVTIDATDSLSGIDSYSIQIDDAKPFVVKQDTLENNEYILPIQIEGEHELIVVAYDRAGNHTESRTRFSSSEITSPVLSVHPDYIVRNNTAEIRGTTDYSQSNVNVFVQPEGEEIRTYPVVTLTNGTFKITTAEFKSSGIVSIWSENVFSDTIKSRPSKKIIIEVHDTDIVKTAKNISYTLFALIIVIVLALILIYITYIGWHKFFGLKRRVAKEVSTTIADIHNAMNLFKDELLRQLEVIENIKKDRELNKKEEKIFKELRKNIETIDEFIARKIKMIK